MEYISEWGGFWGARRIFMYDYVKDKEFLSKVRGLCGTIMQELCHTLKEKYEISAISYLVGSGAKNLIMQNESNPIDLDYNLEIVKCNDINNSRLIKESVRKAFNLVLHKHGWNDCQDSTTVLTTEKRHFTNGNNTEFSIDVCISAVGRDDVRYRLIHKKTGFSYNDQYVWEEAPHSKGLSKKVKYIKDQGKWQLVRDQYRDIRNRYLRQNDYNHPAFICYIEAVNNVCNAI